jgi:O-glycosyl hydrolase
MKTHPVAARGNTAGSIARAFLIASCFPCSAAMATGVVTPQDEKLFWACNLAANEDKLTRSSLRECMLVYNKILTHRFDGDFLAYLAWRQTNEAEQLRLLQTTERERL